MPSLTSIIRTGGKDQGTGALAFCYKQLHENTMAPAAWRHQARTFLSQGDLDRCRLVLETLLHAAPQDVAAHLMLGEVALQSGSASSCDEAVAACRHAHKLSMDQDATIQAHTSCALGVALASKARVPSIAPEHRTELRESALDVMQQCLTTCPKDHLLTSLHYNTALVSAELGLLPQALKHAHAGLENAQKLAPQDRCFGGYGEHLMVSCVLLLAVLLTARQQMSEALAVLGVLDQPHALEGAPPEPISQRFTPQQQVLSASIQSGILSAQGDLVAAVAVLTHCRMTLASHAGAEAAGATAQVWQELAFACARAGAAADACHCAEQALQVEPWSAASHSAAGSAHESAGQHAQALDSYGTALALDPHHTHALMRKGALLARAGTLTHLSAGRDLLSEGLHLDPSNATGWYQMGLACRAMHHMQAAEKYLRTAMLLATTMPVLPFRTLPLSYPQPAPESDRGGLV